jgi:hypothetical protein
VGCGTRHHTATRKGIIMGKITEVVAISDAIIETEREIAGEAWGEEETERDDSGRSLEEMGEGLEGQHEPEGDDELEGEEPEGEEESDGEGEKKPEPIAAKDGKAEPKPGAQEQPEGGRGVPSGEYRKVAERARAAEAERDALRAQIEKSTGDKSLADRLDLAMREINDLKRVPREAPKAAEPPKAETVPDQFEDPVGFANFLRGEIKSGLSTFGAKLEENRVETSMAIAHAFHKGTFEEAFKVLSTLPLNPENASVVQRIYRSPNPGEALVAWHKRNETFARVGDDPAKFEEKIRTETREALMKDPEFRKQLIAAARSEAAAGDNGQPRTVTRLPRTLNGASGSNLGVDRGDPHQNDDSDQAVAESAWR